MLWVSTTHSLQRGVREALCATKLGAKKPLAGPITPTQGNPLQNHPRQCRVSSCTQLISNEWVSFGQKLGPCPRWYNFLVLLHRVTQLAMTRGIYMAYIMCIQLVNEIYHAACIDEGNDKALI